MQISEIDAYFDRLRSNDSTVLEELHSYVKKVPVQSLDSMLSHVPDVVDYVDSHEECQFEVESACNLLLFLIKNCSKPAIEQLLSSNEFRNIKLNSIPFCLQKIFICAIIHLYNEYPHLLTADRLRDILADATMWDMCLPKLQKLKYVESTKDEIRGMLSSEDYSIRIRIYDLCCALDDPVVWNRIKDDLSSDDSLLYAACVQTLIQFVNNYDLLEKNGIIDILKLHMDINHPSVLQFFAVAIRNGACEVDSNFVDRLIHWAVDSRNAFSIETLGFIWCKAKTVLTLKSVESIGALINELVRSPSTETKLAALECCAYLLESPSEDTLEGLAIDIQPILKLALQPFVDVRLACHKVFKAVAGSQCGLKKLQHVIGFYDYLLNRNTEHEYSGNQSKWELINFIYEAPYSKDVLDIRYINQIRVYIQNGPYHSLPRPVVADEVI